VVRCGHLDVNCISKDMRRHRARQPVDEAGQLHQPATDHDNFRVEQVDDMGEATRGAIKMPVERVTCTGLAVPGAHGDVLRRCSHTGCFEMIAGKRRSGNPGFQAAGLAAPALRAGQLARTWARAGGCGPIPRQWHAARCSTGH
jgi:hypothetical protein